MSSYQKEEIKFYLIDVYSVLLILTIPLSFPHTIHISPKTHLHNIIFTISSRYSLSL